LANRGVFFIGELREWIDLNLNNSTVWNNGGKWCDFWAIACHCMWNWRNKEMHVEDFIRPIRPVQHVLKMVDDYVQAKRSNEIVVQRHQSVVMVRWLPPKELYVKVNTDGASKGNEIAGCGGLIRGSQGEWLGGYAKCVGVCSAFVAEVLEGLKYVRSRGFQKVELNIDSLTLVQVLKSARLSSSGGGSIAKQSWRMLQLEWKVELTHSYREANKCADKMANVECSLEYETTLFEDCPDFLKS
jgi:ribonuclease HI